jgi:ribosome-binding protein aMBF1 (putative translation factor)
MQPFWALSFPSSEALEECERLRTRVGVNTNPTDIASPAPRNTRQQRKTGKQQPTARAQEAQPLPITAQDYAELIEEHFARAVYIL